MAHSLDTTPVLEVHDVTKATITKPPIIHEYVVPEYTKIVQPVIHKEIVKTEVRQITQPIYEEVTRAVRIHENELSHDVKENLAKESIPFDEILKRNESAEPKIFTNYAPAITKKVILQPIIYENVITEVIEEIQPIIHRTVHETHIIKKKEIIHEQALPKTSVETSVTERTVELDSVTSQAAGFTSATSQAAGFRSELAEPRLTPTKLRSELASPSLTPSKVRAELTESEFTYVTTSGIQAAPAEPGLAYVTVTTAELRSEPAEPEDETTEEAVEHIEEAFLRKDVSLGEMKKEIEHLERKMKADGLAPAL
eukprot:Phypoly_transcript_13238.p1 GENE.Phypoly_transcript_13238~~Phypoly_transcript_13238.p1  ORF type:complete len:343 (+),score=63.75 Phypoly_transcript_13238:94-1029(+)